MGCGASSAVVPGAEAYTATDAIALAKSDVAADDQGGES